MDKNDIMLRPTFIYWVNKNFVLMGAIFAVFLIWNYFFQSYEYIKYFVMILCLWLGGKITYSYVDILFCTSWLITEEQIKIYRGVFSKSINYIELYRVYDYSEEQSFIQSLTHNTTVIIFSGDRSTPKLVIAGIEANTEIINIIRKRVELQKKSNLVYEVTNNKY